MSSKKPINRQFVSVKTGDSLWSIAARLLGYDSDKLFLQDKANEKIAQAVLVLYQQNKKTIKNLGVVQPRQMLKIALLDAMIPEMILDRNMINAIWDNYGDKTKLSTKLIEALYIRKLELIKKIEDQKLDENEIISSIRLLRDTKDVSINSLLSGILLKLIKAEDTSYSILIEAAEILSEVGDQKSLQEAVPLLAKKGIKDKLEFTLRVQDHTGASV